LRFITSPDSSLEEDGVDAALIPLSMSFARWVCSLPTAGRSLGRSVKWYLKGFEMGEPDAMTGT